MHVDLHDVERRRLGRVEIDAAARPTRISVQDAARRHPSREIFLNWEGALDDGGRLRRCVACGCPDMFKTKSFPQITIFVVILAFAGAVLAALGYAADPLVLALLVVVLLCDVAILLFSRPLLVCYRCRTTCSHLEIARYHRRWDRQQAERWPAGIVSVPDVTMMAEAQPLPVAPRT